MSGSSLGFSYQTNADSVLILRNGVTVVVLRGKAAAKFSAAVAGLDEDRAQQLMARATGNYKRGNERQAKQRRSGKR